MEIDGNLIKSWARLMTESTKRLDGESGPLDAVLAIKDDGFKGNENELVEAFIVGNIAEGSLDEFLKVSGPTSLLLGKTRTGYDGMWDDAYNGMEGEDFRVTYADLGLGKEELVERVKEWVKGTDEGEIRSEFGRRDFEYDLLDEILWRDEWQEKYDNTPSMREW